MTPETLGFGISQQATPAGRKRSSRQYGRLLLDYAVAPSNCRYAKYYLEQAGVGPVHQDS